jgi:hypothetical protein
MEAKSLPLSVGFVYELAFHPADQVFVRRPRKDTIELRAIIVNKTDILDDDIVDFPLFAVPKEPVTNGELLVRVGHDGARYLGVRFVNFFIDIDKSLAAIRFDPAQIGFL